MTVSSEASEPTSSTPALLRQFEQLVRQAYLYTAAEDTEQRIFHPFETRNIHASLPPKVRQLFDNGHYAEATFEAYKFIDKTVQRLGSSQDTGYGLMMGTLTSDTNPKIRLTSLSNETEKNEQKGFGFIFAGSASAIRNPRAHEFGLTDSIDLCLDHLCLASMLLRRLEAAGHNLV